MPTPFQEKIYAKLRKVPEGKITTYKELARSINSRAARAAGTAMRKNPYSPEVPCHRVVLSNGGIGQFSGKEGVDGKIELLEREGIEIKKGKVVDFEKRMYIF